MGRYSDYVVSSLRGLGSRRPLPVRFDPEALALCVLLPAGLIAPVTSDDEAVLELPQRLSTYALVQIAANAGVQAHRATDAEQGTVLMDALHGRGGVAVTMLLRGQRLGVDVLKRVQYETHKPSGVPRNWRCPQVLYVV
jgi:hypothetical protein